MSADSRASRWDFPVYLIVRMLVCVISALTLPACHRLSQWLATLCCDVLKIRRGTVEENLQHAFPDMTPEQRHTLAWNMWEHLFLMICEIAQTPRKIHETNWREHVTLVNQAPLVKQLVCERPSAIVCGHYGNFELSGYMLGMWGLPSYTIARRLDNRFLDRWVNEFRGAKGQHILPKEGSAKQIDSILSAGGTLVFLADQHAGGKGCWVEFFGRKASTHKAIALFSLTNDAPLLLCFARRAGKPLQHHIGMAVQADPREPTAETESVTGLTQWYASRLEQIIREDPNQYWWLHRRWRDSPPAKKAKATESTVPSQAA